MDSIMMTGRLSGAVLLFASILMLTAMPLFSAQKEQEQLRKIKLALQWFPQAQFAGYYVAKDLGIYRKYGLDVEFVPRQPQIPLLSILKTKQADFITHFLSAGMKMREDGEKIVNIAQLSQHSSLVFIAKEKSGINKIEDINGKRLGLWTTDFREIPKAMLHKFGINAEIVPITSGINLFLWDGIDVLTVMWYNEYHQIIAAGINEDELTTFFFQDYNLDIPEDGIYCLQETFDKDPELCKNFVFATMEGWRQAFIDKKNTLEIVKKYCKEQHIEFSLARQQWMLDKIENLIITPNRYPGFLSAKVYQESAKKMRSGLIIKTIPQYNDFYKNVFNTTADNDKVEHVQE
jgi:NitT/TauT family transport system substrate-binding protein